MKVFLLTRLLPTLAVLLAVGGAVLAQSPADGGPSPTGATAVPLDGGISMLLAGGVAYGLRQLRSRRRRA